MLTLWFHLEASINFRNPQYPELSWYFSRVFFGLIGAQTCCSSALGTNRIEFVCLPTPPQTTTLTRAFHLSALYICNFFGGLFVPWTKYIANEITFKTYDIGNLQRGRKKEFPLWSPNKLHSIHPPSQKMFLCMVQTPGTKTKTKTKKQ